MKPLLALPFFLLTQITPVIAINLGDITQRYQPREETTGFDYEKAEFESLYTPKLSIRQEFGLNNYQNPKLKVSPSLSWTIFDSLKDVRSERIEVATRSQDLQKQQGRQDGYTNFIQSLLSLRKAQAIQEQYSAIEAVIRKTRPQWFDIALNIEEIPLNEIETYFKFIEILPNAQRLKNQITALAQNIAESTQLPASDILTADLSALDTLTSSKGQMTQAQCVTNNPAITVGQLEVRRQTLNDAIQNSTTFSLALNAGVTVSTNEKFSFYVTLIPTVRAPNSFSIGANASAQAGLGGLSQNLNLSWPPDQFSVSPSGTERAKKDLLNAEKSLQASYDSLLFDLSQRERDVLVSKKRLFVAEQQYLSYQSSIEGQSDEMKDLVAFSTFTTAKIQDIYLGTRQNFFCSTRNESKVFKVADRGGILWVISHVNHPYCPLYPEILQFS
jgi:hypothetical protein